MTIYIHSFTRARSMVVKFVSWVAVFVVSYDYDARRIRISH